jgi:hypothetical protein
VNKVCEKNYLPGGAEVLLVVEYRNLVNGREDVERISGFADIQVERKWQPTSFGIFLSVLSDSFVSSVQRLSRWLKLFLILSALLLLCGISSPKYHNFERWMKFSITCERLESHLEQNEYSIWSLF